MDNKPMTASESGRLGVKGRIKKNGLENYLKMQSEAGKSRSKKMTKERRHEIAKNAVGFREQERKRLRSMSDDDLDEYFKMFPRRVRLLSISRLLKFAERMFNDVHIGNYPIIVNKLVGYYLEKNIKPGRASR